jgi:L-threonine kinase
MGVTMAITRPGVDVATGAGIACGTFGELLQGALPQATGMDHFLVTFPIARWTRAWFRFEPDAALRVFPSHKLKSRRLAEMLLAAHRGNGGGTLIIDSDLPVGKGLASSSADLVATARAVGPVLGLEASPRAIEGWLRPIEPTDGVMYPGVVVFEHREVRAASELGVLPPLTVVAVDEGGEIDTVAFNRRPRQYSPAQRQEYARLLDALTGAVQAGDLAALGAVTTRSAILNQRMQPKRHLEDMLAISRAAGALGVVCAHSGTMLGILLADDAPGHAGRLREVTAECEAVAGPAAGIGAEPVRLFHSFTPDGTETRHAI